MGLYTARLSLIDTESICRVRRQVRPGTRLRGADGNCVEARHRRDRQLFHAALIMLCRRPDFSFLFAETRHGGGCAGKGRWHACDATPFRLYAIWHRAAHCTCRYRPLLTSTSHSLRRSDGGAKARLLYVCTQKIIASSDPCDRITLLCISRLEHSVACLRAGDILQRADY